MGYALFGPSSLVDLSAWLQTWLRGLPFVYVPDEPVGKYRKNYRPIHVGESGRDGLWNRVVDSNMLWAVHIANATFPDVAWIFVVDSDTFVFPKTVEDYARIYDPSRPVILAWSSPGWTRGFWASKTSTYIDCANAPTCPNSGKKDGSHPWSHDCCMCPVRRADERDYCFNATSPCPTNHKGRPRIPYVLDWQNGKAHYAAPPYGLFGGTGILIAKSLLNQISSEDWVKCTEKMVCGPGDARLATCIHNLASAQTVHMDHNIHFMKNANISWSAAYRNEQYTTFSMPRGSLRPRNQESARSGILQLLQKGKGAICPWALHKLHPRDAELVSNHSKHCISINFSQPLNRTAARKRCRTVRSNGAEVLVCNTRVPPM